MEPANVFVYFMLFADQVAREVSGGDKEDEVSGDGVYVMNPKYSGDESIEFWNQVNALSRERHAECYSLGCALQDLEHRVLTTLHNAQVDDEYRLKNAQNDGNYRKDRMASKKKKPSRRPRR